jgi:hypothetical protein
MFWLVTMSMLLSVTELRRMPLLWWLLMEKERPLVMVQQLG